MFKFVAICLMALVALAAAKPGIVAYSAYSSPLIAASPYTAAYTAAAYGAPLAASPYLSSPYLSSPYIASPYAAAAYSAYPYAAAAPLLLRR